MGNIAKRNTVFLLAWLVAVLAALWLIISHSQTGLHLLVNQYHSPFFDVVFKWATWIGDGAAAVILMPVLFFVRIRYGLYLLGAFVASGLATQLLKHLVFPGALRPVSVFQEQELHLVEGVRMLHQFSFPSGHATTAFALFFVLAYIIGRTSAGMLCAIAAVLVAFSRVYLSLHFMEDILAGSLVGILFAMLCIYLINKINWSWSDKALLSLWFQSSRQNEQDK